jgi:hypothetical protein
LSDFLTKTIWSHWFEPPEKRVPEQRTGWLVHVARACLPGDHLAPVQRTLIQFVSLKISSKCNLFSTTFIVISFVIKNDDRARL